MSNRGEIIFVNLLFFFIAGIFIAYQFPSATLQTSLFFAIGTLTITLLTLNFSYAKLKIYRFKVYTTLLIYGLLFCIGACCCLVNIKALQTDYFAEKKFDHLKISIDEAPQHKGNFIRFKASIKSGFKDQQEIYSQGRLLVTLSTTTDRQSMFNYGDVLLIPAKYKEVEAPRNPAEFDYKAWLATQNIHHQVYIAQQQAILIDPQAGNPLIAYALKLRKRQIDQLKVLLHDADAFSVASTLILGYRTDLSKETLNDYAKTGTIHALSVSGMHVGIIYMVLMWLFSFMDQRQLLKIVKAFIIIGLIWFYALLTGFSPSVLRSAIMITTYIVAKTWNQRTNSYNILAFSALSLLVYQPLLLFDVGFQLSYLAVFGLIYLQPIFYQLFYFKNSWADKVWSLSALSLAAQLATFPLSVYYFHQFPVYFLVSNLFIVLPVTLMMYIGLILLLFKLYFLAPLLEWIITFTNKGLAWIADLPYSTISGIWWNKTELLLVSGFLIFITLAFHKQDKKCLFIALTLFMVLQSIFNFQYFAAYHQQKIIVFNLRKNYAVAYVQSNSAVLYTDLSPESNTFQYSIKPCLDQHRVSTIRFKIDTSDLKKIKHL